METLKASIFTQINSGKQPVVEQALSPQNTGDKTGREMLISWDDNMVYLCILKCKVSILLISSYFIISPSEKPDITLSPKFI